MAWAMAQSWVVVPPWESTRCTSAVVVPAISATCAINDSTMLHSLGGTNAFRRLDAPIQAWRSTRVKPLVPLGHPNEEREEKSQMARTEPLKERSANWRRRQNREGGLAARRAAAHATEQA